MPNDKNKNMPFPWTAIGGVASTLLGGFSQANQNRRSEAFSREMYDRQFQDNLAQWHRANEYNDPAAQMQRLRDAGLNPMMMYGGSGGSASAGNASGPADVPSPQTPQFIAPRWDALPKQLAQIADVGVKNAQRGLLVQEQINKALDYDKGEFDLWQKKQLHDWSFELLKQQANATFQNAEKVRRENIYDETTGMSVKTMEEIRKLELENAGTITKNLILGHQEKLWDEGINPNKDPLWLRAVIQALKDPSSAKKVLKETWDILTGANSKLAPHVKDGQDRLMYPDRYR